jgi:hypothetical protein
MSLLPHSHLPNLMGALRNSASRADAHTATAAMAQLRENQSLRSKRHNPVKFAERSTGAAAGTATGVHFRDQHSDFCVLKLRVAEKQVNVWLLYVTISQLHCLAKHGCQIE